MLRPLRQPLAVLLLAAGFMASFWPGAAELAVAQEMGLKIVVHADETATVASIGDGKTETVPITELAAAALRASEGVTDIRVILSSDEPMSIEVAYELLAILSSAGFRVALVAEDKD